ncbi:PIR protein [Plasmodium vivax]|nr:PIR protein [Plasmodium vivax]
MFSEKYCYLNYGEYAEGKAYFNKANQIVDREMDRFQKIMKLIPTEKIPSSSNELFKKLHIYLAYDLPVFHYKSHQYCGYINYWLNNQALQLYNGEIDDSKYSIFDRFLKELKKEKTFVSCESYLQCINSSDALKKMNTLYTLYDDYDDFMNKKDNNGKYSCNTLYKLRLYYNEAIKEYDGNEDKLINKLMDLKKLIGKNEDKLKRECKAEMSSFNKPTKYLQEQDNLRILAEREKQQQLEKLNEQKKQEQEQEQPIIHASSPTEQETHTSADIEPQHQTFISSASHEVQEHSVGRAFSEVPQLFKGPADSYGSEILVREGPEDVLRNMNGEHRQLSTGYYRLENRDITASNATGFFEKMKGGITGVLGEIDPVPVVGVSGGMGALFLLFRYTPFGTYFRGGRGRANRIPRSFNGQFLGGFQGYEDYDVGHIGYGPMNIPNLAE